MEQTINNYEMVEHLEDILTEYLMYYFIYYNEDNTDKIMSSLNYILSDEDNNA